MTFGPKLNIFTEEGVKFKKIISIKRFHW